MEVSVVIPLFNKEQYISRTIDSVLNQTVQPSEIIVVNDGSTDDSESIVKKYSDPRIRLITQENAGEGAARNRGIKEARFDLIAFLDADDEWKPDFLMIIRRLRNNFPDCGAYATSYEIIGKNGKANYPILSEIPPAPWIGIIPNLLKPMQVQTPFCSSSIAISKDVLNEIDGFPEGVKLGGDRICWIKLGIRFPIAYCAANAAIYHSEANNRVLNTYQIENEMQIISFVEQMINNRDIPQVLLNDLRNLAAALRIQRAHHLLLSGKTILARRLLGTVGKSQKFKIKKLKLLFLSFIPIKILHFVIKIRDSQKY